jgi:hypothetical protein
MRIWVIAICHVALISNSLGEAAPRITLQTQIVSERYCEVDEHFTSLLVKFSVKLTNSGDRPIKLNPPFSPVLLVARSVSDLDKRKLEFKLHPPDLFALPKQQTSRIQSTRSEPKYVILNPGQTYQSQTTDTTVPTLRTWNPRYRHGGLRPGVHFVQLVIPAEIEGQGVLKVTSPAVEIDVNNNPDVIKCE